MFWPIAAPRIYAAGGSSSSPTKVTTDDDDQEKDRDESNVKRAPSSASHAGPNNDENADEAVAAANGANGEDENVAERATTRDQDWTEDARRPNGGGASSSTAERKDGAIIGLRVSRSGHIFVTMTADTIAIWQARVGIALGRHFVGALADDYVCSPPPCWLPSHVQPDR
jgi:hypothetical protein